MLSILTLVKRKNRLFDLEMQYANNNNNNENIKNSQIRIFEIRFLEVLFKLHIKLQLYIYKDILQ